MKLYSEQSFFAFKNNIFHLNCRQTGTFCLKKLKNGLYNIRLEQFGI